MSRLPADFLPPTPSRRLTVTSADGTRLAVQVHDRAAGDLAAGPVTHPIAGPVTHPIAEPVTVVLVHGWTLSSTFWVRVLHRLPPGLRVVVVDQRGHGRSEPVPAGGFTSDAIADDLAAVLEATVPTGTRAVVAGHSMGAMAIVALAGRHPDVLRERVATALLASTGVDELVGRMTVLPQLPHRAGRPPAPPGPMRLRLLRHAIGDARGLHRMALPVARATVAHSTMSRTATPLERAYCTDIVLACPLPTYEGFGQMLSDLDLATELKHLDVPTHVLVGTQDRLTPPWHAHRMAAALPHPVGLTEVQGAGHMTPLTAPGDVAAVIGRLSRTWASR